MKKLLKCFMLFVFVIALSLAGIGSNAVKAAEYVETAYQGTYYGRVIAVDGLYVYSQPDVTSQRLDGGVSHNWLVQCLTYTSNGFTKIKYYYGNKKNTFVGYVHSQYLEVTKQNETTTTTEKFVNIYGYTGVVTAYSLNVHSSLNFNGSDKKIFTTIERNRNVQVLAKSKSWYKIKFDYKNQPVTGYVSRSYVKVKDAMKNLTLVIPTQTFSASTKYKLSVTDTTIPYALSKKITWSSSKKSIATVNSSGIVTAKNPGTAKIIANVKCGDRSRKLTIKVTVKEYFVLE